MERKVKSHGIWTSILSKLAFDVKIVWEKLWNVPVRWMDRCTVFGYDLDWNCIPGGFCDVGQGREEMYKDL